MNARQRSVAALLVCLLLPVWTGCTSDDDPTRWRDWEAFARRFVSQDGRVVDVTFDRRTVSEGQAYALFFALVAGQRAQFDRILRWTSDHLAQGHLGAQLPAWHWGRHADGRWGVIDPNSAADADLWLAYDLLEAGRLWQQPAYTEIGRRLAEQVANREIVDTGGPAGRVLMPAPAGFQLGDGRYRIDPSYLPGFIFRYLAVTDPVGPWQQVWDDYLRQAPTIMPRGIAPDLYVLAPDGSVSADTERAPCGSYDAIRVYLWAGMSGDNSRSLLSLLKPYAALIRADGAPPEKVDPRSGEIMPGFKPIGFSGAVLPYLQAIGDHATLKQQRRRLWWARLRIQLGARANYYDQALILFGKGWVDGRYRFDDQGRVQPAWTAPPTPR
jgi:endo-1,4-beta-D-glucanase Y